MKTVLLGSVLLALPFGGCNCNPVNVGGDDGGVDGGAGANAPADDGGALAESCDFELTGTTGDDDNVLYDLVISRLPASIEMELENTFEEPELSITYRDETDALISLACEPSNCDGSVATQGLISLSAEFPEENEYIVWVENFDLGGDFTLTGTIFGDATACDTIALR